MSLIWFFLFLWRLLFRCLLSCLCISLFVHDWTPCAPAIATPMVQYQIPAHNVWLWLQWHWKNYIKYIVLTFRQGKHRKKKKTFKKTNKLIHFARTFIWKHMQLIRNKHNTNCWFFFSSVDKINFWALEKPNC